MEVDSWENHLFLWAIFHGYVSHNQMVKIKCLDHAWPVSRGACPAQWVYPRPRPHWWIIIVYHYGILFYIVTILYNYCVVLYFFVLYYATLYYIILDYIILFHIISYHILLYFIILNIVPYRIKLYHNIFNMYCQWFNGHFSWSNAWTWIVGQYWI